MNLQVVEDALRAWVKTATGLDDSHVYFANQQVAQPSDGPFITILVATNGVTLGLPEITRTTDLTQPLGKEVAQDGLSIWDLSVTFQAFAENTVSYPVPSFPIVLPTGQGITAVELLAKVQLALNLESVHGALNAAGISPYEYGTIRRVDAVIETYWEGRAILEMKCYVSDSAEEGVGYVAEVTGTGEISGTGDAVDPRNIPYQAGP
jgi:hypothetical protein